MTEFAFGGFRCALFFLLLIVAGPRLAAAPPEVGPPGQINLTLDWNDNSGGSHGFILHRATTVNGPWKWIGATEPGVTTFLDMGVRPQTTYYYRVYAVGEEGYSDFSNVATVTTPRAATIPVIRRHPTAQASLCGTQVLFSAQASGTPPLLYQWQFNGTNIDGQTGTSLLVDSVQPERAGDYAVAVRNANGTARSYPARLTVMSPLTIQTIGGGVVAPNWNGINLEVGRRYSIRATPAAGSAFQRWRGGTNNSSSPVLSFVMETNLVLEASFIDITRPIVAVAAPLPNARVGTATLPIRGTTRDNRELAEVRYQVNDGAWTPAFGTTNWEGSIDLVAGRNTLRIFATDLAGNRSLTNLQYVTYVVNQPLSVGTNGSGMVSPNYDGRWLEIGQTYSMSVRPGLGFVFTNWTVSDGVTTMLTNRPALAFQMRSNLSLRANFVDVTRPTVTVTAPLANARLTNATLNLTGQARDNDVVTEVRYQLNSGDWNVATGTSNWSSQVNLRAGKNTLRTYALDATGNRSLTNLLTIVHAVNFPLTVRTNGAGVITPDYNGRPLEIGQTFALSVRPGAGYVFTNWTVSDGLTTAITNRVPFYFEMRSNLVLRANFLDIQRPTITVSNSFPKGRLLGDSAMLRGGAADNGQLTGVWYRLNNGPWRLAEGTARWSAPVQLLSGTNVFSVFSMDADGNRSLTNTLSAAVTVVQPVISAFEMVGGHFVVSFASVTNVNYSLEGRDALEGSEWSRVAGPLAGTGGPLQLIDPTPAPARFYRLQAVSP